MSEEECRKLEITVGTLAWLQQELEHKRLTVARLRSLFGIKTSEKTRKVLRKSSGDDAESSQGDEGEGGEGQGQGAESEGSDPSDTTDPKRQKGHGRNGASSYTGAERIAVKHASLAPGDTCPRCTTPKKGNVYEQNMPRTLVRVRGEPPVAATVYELQTLRCNLCGVVFVADPSAGVGNEKYDATTASMIALLKYGSGVPFNRLQGLQGNLGVPLPVATQWDIVAGAARQLSPVHQELLPQAAQGRLVHNAV